MKINMQTLVLSGLLCALLTACGGDSKSDSSGAEKKPTAKPNTEKVPSKPPKTNTNPSSSGKVANEWVKAHNKYRKMHQVGNVKWSAKLAKSAEKFAKNCPQGHAKSGYGENMAWGFNGESMQSVVGRWYKEVSEYDFNNPRYDSSTGHFTQVVWKKTTEIGCATQNNCTYKGKTYPKLHVCRYNPAGNITNAGYFKENVLPKK